MIRTGYDLLEYAMVITFVVIAIVAIIPAGTGDNVIAVLEQLGVDALDRGAHGLDVRLRADDLSAGGPFLYYPSRKRVPAGLKAFIDMLIEKTA